MTEEKTEVEEVVEVPEGVEEANLKQERDREEETMLRILR
jgi:hypothetical protein